VGRGECKATALHLLIDIWSPGYLLAWLFSFVSHFYTSTFRLLRIAVAPHFISTTELVPVLSDPRKSPHHLVFSRPAGFALFFEQEQQARYHCPLQFF
jgi:hypothetical protein